MRKVLDKVRSIKDETKFYRDFQQYDEALKPLLKALEILKSEYERVEQELKSQDSAEASGEKSAERTELEEYKEELRRELADCYGMSGGLYRRLGDYENSAKMYEWGRRYERDDSYNLVNSIVVPILHHPEKLDNEATKKDIHDALQIVEAQVKEKRRRQWWAWADLGLLSVLADDVNGAIDAYGKFRETGARSQDYESTKTVLDSLDKRCRETGQPVKNSITQAIQYLNDTKASLP
jgi:tetratricopeptide (TPR) repeat protein